MNAANLEGFSSDYTPATANSKTLGYTILSNITDATTKAGTLPMADNASPLQTDIPTGNVLPGIHYDLHDQAPSGENRALTIDSDNLGATAIPEPSSIGIVAASLLGGYAIGRYWRRWQAQSDA